MLGLYRAEGGAFARSSFGCRGGNSVAWRACRSGMELRGESGLARDGQETKTGGDGRGVVARLKAACACARARGHGAGELLAWAVEEEDGLALGPGSQPEKRNGNETVNGDLISAVRSEINGRDEMSCSEWSEGYIQSGRLIFNPTA